MEENRKNKFEKFLSPKKSNFIEESEIFIEQADWQLASAAIIFKLLDFMESQEPKLKQKDVAERLDVSPQYVNKLLRGTENLTLETMEKIASLLNLNIFQFMVSLFREEDNEEEQTKNDVFQIVFCKEEKITAKEIISSSFLYKKNVCIQNIALFNDDYSTNVVYT